jgi:copper chaperone NosL
MSRFALARVMFSAIALTGCGQEKELPPPPPFELTSEAIGHYCGMNLLEHTGPKGQVILASGSEPFWFSSARDALSFTMLPEEAKDIRAIYVSDMGKAKSWDNPGSTNWVDARRALFVVGSSRQGGMGAPETVPFSERAAAETFAAAYGGRIVKFDEVPRDYVLGPGSDAEATEGQSHDGSQGDVKPAPAP